MKSVKKKAIAPAIPRRIKRRDCCLDPGASSNLLFRTMPVPPHSRNEMEKIKPSGRVIPHKMARIRASLERP